MMDSTAREMRRAELQGWIHTTHALQQRMMRIFGALGALSFGLWLVNGTAGGFALVIVALVAIASFWIMAAHNAAHRQKLAELDQVAKNDGKPLQTAHRRWHRAPDGSRIRPQ